MPTSMSVPPHFPNMNAMPPKPMNAMSTQNMNAQFANMPFAPNPYYVVFSILKCHLACPNGITCL